jgi:hypothetical protein
METKFACGTKSIVRSYAAESAEEVMAHAAWQRKRGRNPSMSFVGERNPRKALAVAMAVIQQAQRTELVNEVAGTVLKGKSYWEMTDAEFKLAVRRIICDSSSEEEVERRLREELEYLEGICLHADIPEDATGREARELVRGLGGLVMKNGAMAMAMLWGPNGNSISL